MLLRLPSRTEIRSLLFPSLMLAAAALCNASTITYNVNQPIGAGGVTGDIITDAKIGALGPVDIVDWNLLLNDGSTTFDLTGPLSGGNSVFEGRTFTGALSATATQLLFNFSDTSGINFFYFLQFPQTPPGTLTELCFQSVPDTCTTGAQGSGEVLYILQPNLNNPQFTSLSGTQVIGSATSVPEPSTLALLGGGIALLAIFQKKTIGLRRGVR